MKKHFNELFAIEKGMVTPKVAIHINGVTMGPGVGFGGGVSFGGVDLTQYVGKNFAVEIQTGVHVIKGVYN